ncbi:hypothetical protein SLA2020_062230 [Shorea laevis]
MPRQLPNVTRLKSPVERCNTGLKRENSRSSNGKLHSHRRQQAKACSRVSSPWRDLSSTCHAQRDYLRTIINTTYSDTVLNKSAICTNVHRELFVRGRSDFIH